MVSGMTLISAEGCVPAKSPSDLSGQLDPVQPQPLPPVLAPKIRCENSDC